jgi:hypothetical protein
MSRFLVSIHDVSPAFEPEIAELWAACSSFGIVPALLVVPDWHGHWPLESRPGFVTWLHWLVARGAEILLHGERHDVVGARRSFGAWWRGLGRAAAEGEFLALRWPAALAKLDRGVERLRRLGFGPIGFVPPAWLARPEVHRAVWSVGLRCSEDAAAVYLARGEWLRAPAVRWSARNRWRALGSAVVAEGRWRVQRREPLIRIALHPGDVHDSATWTSLRAALRRWSGIGTPIRYGDL